MQEELIDFAEALTETRVVDLVDRMVVVGHEDHRVFINEAGIVYCLTCMPDGYSIGAMTDYSEHTCGCGCFKTCHSYDTGDCLQCGRPRCQPAL